MSVIKARAPVTGGNFGVWGGMFSTFDCAVKGYRQKEDAWNAIISGFMTGGCLAARSESGDWSFPPLSVWHCLVGGPKSAFGSAVACSILLGVFEGVGVLINRIFAEGNRPQLPPCTSLLFFSYFISSPDVNCCHSTWKCSPKYPSRIINHTTRYFRRILDLVLLHLVLSLTLLESCRIIYFFQESIYSNSLEVRSSISRVKISWRFYRHKLCRVHNK